jgi:Cof subfamily protein (haloacid dehalogenase superfamily)
LLLFFKKEVLAFFFQMISLLVSDIDGTLVTSDKRLTPAAKQAARSLSDHGVKLVLTSSRPPRGVALFADAMGLDTPRAGFNGGAIVAPDGKLLSFKPLEPDVASTTLAHLQEAGINPWLFTADEWLLINPHGAYVECEQHTVQMNFRVVPNFDDVLDKAGKIMAASRDFAALAECETALQEQLCTRASVHRSQDYYLDITHPAANKGQAVRDAARLLDIPLSETACIGDMPNDLPMFDVAAIKIAMGNAPEFMRARADFVTHSNEADGWAHAVNSYVVPRAKGDP